LLRLQERDLDLFVSLSIARYLSVYAIEWLRFNGWRRTGGWRECNKAFLEKRKSDPSAVYCLAPNIYRCFTALSALALLPWFIEALLGRTGHRRL
jgi:hypothetical protein